MPFFRDRYTCVTFAHRGFSPSSLVAGGPDPQDFADDLAALIRHLELTDVGLVAQSMGGWTCLEYTLREPARVRALVMAATLGTVTPPASSPPAGQDAAAAHLTAAGIHPAAGERMAREQPALHFLYQQISNLSAALDRTTLRARLYARRTRAPEELAHLPVRVLGITGEEDLLVPSAQVEWLSSRIPGAHVERIPQAGHSVYFERPDLFNRVVADFLAVVPVRG